MALYKSTGNRGETAESHSLPSGRHRHHQHHHRPHVLPAHHVTCTVGHIRVRFHGGAARLCQFLTSMYIKVYRRHLEAQVYFWTKDWIDQVMIQYQLLFYNIKKKHYFVGIYCVLVPHLIFNLLKHLTLYMFMQSHSRLIKSSPDHKSGVNNRALFAINITSGDSNLLGVFLL